MKHATTVLCLSFIAMNAILAIHYSPRLIGFGCDGSHIPQLARYESDFPQCERIERIF